MQFVSKTLLSLCLFCSLFFLQKSEAQESSESASSVYEVKEAGSNDKFHRNIIREARKQMIQKKITRLQYMTIRTRMISPAFRKMVEDVAITQMQHSGS